MPQSRTITSVRPIVHLGRDELSTLRYCEQAFGSNRRPFSYMQVDCELSICKRQGSIINMPNEESAWKRDWKHAVLQGHRIEDR